MSYQAPCQDTYFSFRSSSDPGAWGEKWRVDEGVLVAKVSKIGPVAGRALAEAIADWWDMDSDATVEGFRAVGLNVFPGD